MLIIILISLWLLALITFIGVFDSDIGARPTLARFVQIYAAAILVSVAGHLHGWWVLS